jgi:hypothetical protein
VRSDFEEHKSLPTMAEYQGGLGRAMKRWSQQLDVLVAFTSIKPLQAREARRE